MLFVQLNILFFLKIFMTLLHIIDICMYVVWVLCRNGLTADSKKMSFAEMMTDDAQTSREERCFRLWINSLGTATYVNNLFEDVRNG